MGFSTSQQRKKMYLELIRNLYSVVLRPMLTLKTRFLLFMIVCIPIRSYFVYLASTIDSQYLPYMGYAALIPAIGMMYIYLTDSRTHGIEAGEKIWWNHLRPIHSVLYFTFAILAICKKTDIAWKPLLVDDLIAIIAFLSKHHKHFISI